MTDVREHKDGGETFPSGGGEDFKGGGTSKTQLREQAGGDGRTVLKSLSRAEGQLTVLAAALCGWEARRTALTSVCRALSSNSRSVNSEAKPGGLLSKKPGSLRHLDHHRTATVSLSGWQLSSLERLAGSAANACILHQLSSLCSLESLRH